MTQARFKYACSAAGVLTLAGALPAREAHAGTGGSDSCTLSVVPSEVDESWSVAIRALAARLGETGTDTDCRALTIEVSHDRAFVLFTTRDGRQTVREVRSPAELGPVVDALLVSLPPQVKLAAAAPSPSRDAASRERAHDMNATPNVRGEPSAKPVRVVIQLGGGVRVSGPKVFVSPPVFLRASVLANRWEIGAFGAWDPLHTMLGTAVPAGFAMSQYAAGIHAGRREPVGGASLAFGVTTSVVVVNEVGTDMSPSQGGGSAGGPSTAEPHVGAYVALVYPARSALRVRAELATEVVASRIGRTLEVDPALPPLPWWSASVLLGVEWEVP